jgi:iron complex outermembrane receptor protein
MQKLAVLLSCFTLLVASSGRAQTATTDTLLAARTTAATDTPYYQNPFEVTITATRQELLLKLNPAATSLVGEPVLHSMPRTVAVDEALRMVPGVRIDNGSSGSRVHLSIRGQGILTERGIRGTKVLLDGLPLNDPTGFAPDFYDVDWAAVEKIEVLRGPAAAFYGGGSSAGVINIQTENGGDKPVGVKTSHTVGTDNFGKSQWQLGGTMHGINYRVSESRMGGNGYREHQKFYGNNFYFKAHGSPANGLIISPIVSSTEFYNDNSEGLNIYQADTNRTMANPDAIPFNEGQKTRRASCGATADWRFAPDQQLQFTGYCGRTRFYDAGNVSVQHRLINTPGASLQYNLTHSVSSLQNHVSVGGDFRWQQIDEYKNENLKDGVAGGTHEGERQSDQTIQQSGIGVFVIDRLELNPQWCLMACGRYDDIRNKLTDNFAADTVKLSGERNFNKATARVGVAYTQRAELNCYANWGQGFLPPATEELANNPEQYGGFNKSIESATSQGEEFGVRGIVLQNIVYDVAAFYLTTDKDFDRYRGVEPRDQETFYRNLGTSRRTGAEAYLSCKPVRSLYLQLAYTYSHFKYTDPQLLDGKFLPNAPQSQVAADAEYDVFRHVKIGADLAAQSGWYVDVTNTVFQKGFTTVGARVSWNWQLSTLHGEFSLSGKNVFGEKYMGFTEPDDGGDYRDLRPLADRNSFQPAPLQEVFVGVKLEM